VPLDIGSIIENLSIFNIILIFNLIPNKIVYPAVFHSRNEMRGREKERG
jgi:hypothetical protein